MCGVRCIFDGVDRGVGVKECIQVDDDFDVYKKRLIWPVQEGMRSCSRNELLPDFLPMTALMTLFATDLQRRY